MLWLGFLINYFSYRRSNAFERQSDIVISFNSLIAHHRNCYQEVDFYFFSDKMTLKVALKAIIGAKTCRTVLYIYRN